MKFEPRRGQAVGRIVVRPTKSTIVRPDETAGITKYLLLDAVGPDLEAKGLRVGDVVVPLKINSLVLDGGVVFIPFVQEENVALVVRDWKSLDEFHVQIDSGAQYVPFTDPRAAPSRGFPHETPASRVLENGVDRHP